MIIQLNDSPIFHFQFSVGHSGEFLVMGHDDESLIELLTKRKEQFMQVSGRNSVQITTGFIGKDDIWFIDQCASHSYSLLFTSREFVWFMLLAIFQAKEIKNFGASFSTSFLALLAIKPGIHTFSKAVNSGNS